MKKWIQNIGKGILVLALALTMTVPAWANQTLTPNIIHAAGEIDGIAGTNSMEALNNCYYQGYRYIELDFNFTTDGHLVGVHDWERNYFGSDYAFHGAVSYAEFQTLKIEGKYTPITMDSLAKWLFMHPNTYIVTDIKDRNVDGLYYIKQNYSYIIPQIMPQIYSEAEYEPVQLMGFQNIIYTLYKLTYSEKTDTDAVVAFAASHPLYAITFSSELAVPDYITRLKAAGTKLYTHTVNTQTEADIYGSMGVDGVYTDLFL